jgi:alkylation response protein AidB-like acyl-CoA dehydrogenase
MRRRLAEAKSYAETAKVLLLADTRRLMEMAAEYAPLGRRFSREESASFALNAARCVDLCVQAVDQAFIAAGTTAAYTGQPMERCLRDMKMMQTHAAYRLDAATENWALAHFDL